MTLEFPKERYEGRYIELLASQIPLGPVYNEGIPTGCRPRGAVTSTSPSQNLAAFSSLSEMYFGKQGASGQRENTVPCA